MAAGDAAMQMLAQAFSGLAQNAMSATSALRLTSQQATKINSQFSKFSLNQIRGVFSDIGSKFSKSFSGLSTNVQNFAKALDLSDQDVAAFGKRLSSFSFTKIQSLFSSGMLSKLGKGASAGGEGMATAAKAAFSGASAAMMRFAVVGGVAMALATKGIVAAAKGIIKGIEVVAKGMIPVAKGVFSGLSAAATAPVAAFGALTGAFTGIIDAVGSFVSSLNPAIMEQLQLAFDDLYAVVGKLFVPIMAAVVPIVRTFADALLPVVQSMIPAFQLFADAMINLAAPVIGIFSGLLATMQPYLEQFAGMVAKIAQTIGQGLQPIIEAMLPYWEALAEIIVMLMDPINQLIGALMSLAAPLINLIVPYLVPALKMLADVVAYIVNKFSWLIGKIAEFAQGFVQPGAGGRLKVPQVTPGASRGTAAKGAQFTGFAEFGQQIMQASFGSSVNTPEFKTAENTAKIADGIQTLVRQGENQAPAAQIGQAARGKF
jgi:phage-related protein